MALAASLCVALLLPTPAGARRHVIAPPGNSGIDQYVPSIPSVAGNRPVNRGLGPVTRAPTISPSTRSTLASLGPVGRAVRRLTAATAPPPVPRRAGRDVVGGPGAGADLGGGGGRSPLPAVLATTGGGTGTGPILPLVLVLAAVGAVLVRRRGGGQPPDEREP
jgi:hypothetical protein